MPTTGIIGYVPPAKIGNPDVFVRNVRQYNTEFPLFLFSDHTERQDVNAIVQSADSNLESKKYPAHSNYYFFTALALAQSQGWERFIYLEEDCRVRGDYWDARIIADYDKKPGAVMGGTPCIWSHLGFSGKGGPVDEFIDTAAKRTGGRAPIFFDERGDTTKPDGKATMWLHSMGALGVYDTRWCLTALPSWGRNPGGLAAWCGPWDTKLGKSIWDIYGMDMFDHFAVIPCQFSGYKDINLDLEGRKKALMDGDVCAIHQVKDDWMPS